MCVYLHIETFICKMTLQYDNINIFGVPYIPIYAEFNYKGTMVIFHSLKKIYIHNHGNLLRLNSSGMRMRMRGSGVFCAGEQLTAAANSYFRCGVRCD